MSDSSPEIRESDRSRSRSESINDFRSPSGSPHSRRRSRRRRSTSRRHRSSSQSSGHASRDRSRRHRSPSQDSSPPVATADNDDAGNKAKIQLCTVHGNDIMPETCNACLHCSHFIKPDMLQQLVVTNKAGPSKIPGPAERLLSRRSDEQDPTLTFSPEDMEIADKMFNMGTFKKGHFEELVKEFLFLPLGQNNILSENIKMENLFKKYEQDKRFRHIFDFKDKLVKLGKELRMAQRPFVLGVGAATELSRGIR